MGGACSGTICMVTRSAAASVTRRRRRWPACTPSGSSATSGVPASISRPWRPERSLTRALNIADGRLMTGGGQRLDPPITLPRGTDDSQVAIAPDGTVRADGQPVGRLQIVNVPSPQGLVAVGDNLFAPSPASGAVRPADAATRVEQGVLESSNVDMADAMVEMMDAQRSFQLASKAINVQDQMLEIANGVKR